MWQLDDGVTRPLIDAEGRGGERCDAVEPPQATADSSSVVTHPVINRVLISMV